MLLTSSSRLAEKRRPIIAMSAAALRQKCFERQEWPPEECGEINTAPRFTSRFAGQELDLICNHKFV
jgi:hypothetical protein